MTISFDYDGTLDRREFQRIAVYLMELGHEVKVITARDSRKVAETMPVYEMCTWIGIPHENIRFTNGESKYKVIRKEKIHVDNDAIEVACINRMTECKGLYVHQWTLANDLQERILEILRGTKKPA